MRNKAAMDFLLAGDHALLPMVVSQFRRPCAKPAALVTTRAHPRHHPMPLAPCPYSALERKGFRTLAHPQRKKRTLALRAKPSTSSIESITSPSIVHPARR